jgi:hypothetical protein
VTGDAAQNPSARKLRFALAALVFALAFALRLLGIGWGLQNETRHQSYHPDELLIKQYADLTPYFKPGFYNYGTMYLTALKLGADMGRTYGWVREGSGVEQWQTDRQIHLTGRVISACSGALTIAFVFLSLLFVTNLLGAALGAAVLGLAPGHLVHSQFQTTDAMSTMFVCLALLLVVRMYFLADDRIPTAASWVAAVIGLAAGTKYAGVVLLPTLWVALWQLRHAWVVPRTLLFFGIAFLVATPGVILEPSAFWMGFTYELAHSAAGHGIVFANTPSGFVYHIGNLAESIGPLPLVIGLAGIVLAAIAKQRWVLPLAVFFLLYYFVIGRAEVKFLRYVLPLLPVVAIGFGYMAGEFHKCGGWYRAAVAALMFVAGYTAISRNGAAQMTTFMRTMDPRDQAAAWIRKEHATATVGFVCDPWFYSPPLFPDAGLLAPQARLEAMSDFPKLKRYVAADGTRKDWDPRLILEQRPDVIVFSSFEFLDNDRINLPELDAFVTLLSKEYEPEAIFWDQFAVFSSKEEANLPYTRANLRGLFSVRFPITHDMMYIRPTICVFKKRPQS